jgi:ABC-type transporter Mla MlaB component
MKNAMKDFTSLKLEANCTVRDAARLKEALLQMQETDAVVTLDVAAVERVETASLQVLCAFVTGRRAAGRAVRWQGESAALTQAAQLSGLAALLDLHGVVSPEVAQPGAPARAAS